MLVKLTWPECEQAAQAGAKRQLLALHDGRPDRYGFAESDPWAMHIEAAGAELAVARTLGLYWVPWARRPADVVVADVGVDVQVRRPARNGGHLLLHPADPDDHRYVLVTGRLPSFTIHGWIAGDLGKSQEWWGDPFNTRRPAFWVPKSALAPIDLLELAPA